MGFILAASHYLPEHVVTNDELVSTYRFPKSTEWLEEKTGIRERRFVGPGETTMSMATEVGRRLLAAHSGGELDLLVVTTSTCDRMMPSCAATVANRLQLKPATAFDVNAACAGFSFALDLVDRFFRTGARRAMIIGSEANSRWINYGDPRTACVLSDGAAGLLVEHVESRGIEASVTTTAPEFAESFVRENLPDMDHAPSQEMLYRGGDSKFMIQLARVMTELGQRALAAAGARIDQMRWVIIQQDTLGLIREVANRLGAAPEQLFINQPKIGNSISPSIAICLSELVSSQQLVDGDRILLVSAGAGIVGGAHVIRY